MRSAAKHRSDSAARSTPTRAPARDTPKKVKLFFRLNIFWNRIFIFWRVFYEYEPIETPTRTRPKNP
ncbi:MAG: hypothetical protein NZ455_08220 [Bacteroidia bacterium]|nr:hypothetical protein [Bacteroidia bacterium]MDW8346337.1 hypothetical protein [Bacteroidia bacterium]